MELERHTKDELRNLINVPKIAITDSSIENMVSILNKDPLFSGIIKTENSKGEEAFSTDSETLVMSYNIERLKKDTEEEYKKHPSFGLTLEEYCRYYLVHGLFHESSHINSINKSNHNLYPYQDLNNIYRIAITESPISNIMDLIIYKTFHRNYFYERNADLNASKLAMEIFDDEKLYIYAVNLYFNTLILY